MLKCKKIFKRGNFIRLIAVPVILLLCAVVYRFQINSSVDVPTMFVVERGESVSGVANRLVQGGLIDSVDVFKASVKAHGGKIQSGQYDIPSGASSWRIADMLANGRVASTTIVIPEGLTIKQIKELLLRSGQLSGPVECDAGNTAPVCNLRDGQIFPDTYTVARGTRRLALLDLARKKMVAVEQDLRADFKKFPQPLKNWNEVVTLASIVQKETPQAREMPIVASVYLNRLNSGMRLQADPTVVYALTDGLGDMRGAALLRGHLQIDSPYNTYKNRGLPPAPIANVGIAALRAVLHPDKTNYLYFVADGRGGHKFARDYATHQKNHERWRKIKNKK